jgi:hypothetical protein
MSDQEKNNMEGHASFSDQFAVTYSIVMGAGVFYRHGDDKNEEYSVKFEVCDRMDCALNFHYDADFARIAEDDRRVHQLNRELDGNREKVEWRRIEIPVKAFCGATLYYKNTINMLTGTKLVFADPFIRNGLLRVLSYHGIELETEKDLRTVSALEAQIFKLMVELATIAEDEKFGHTFLSGITCSMNRGDEKLAIKYEQMISLQDGKPVKKQ